MAMKDAIKSTIFKMPVWQILVLFAVVVIIAGILLINLFAVEMQGTLFYLFMILAMLLITLNGNSVMNEGGLDIATLLHFGITVVFGVSAGFLAVAVTTALALYFAKIQTPIDFFIQKTTMKIWIQTAQLFFTTVFIWAVLAFYGVNIIFSKLLLIYILAFTAGRIVKTGMLLFIARIPPMKILGGTIIFYLVNWYLAKFFGIAYLNFLQSL